MKNPAHRHLVLFAALCGVTGLAGWAFYVAALSREPAQDWMVYYSAARAALDGNLALLFDGDRFTALMNARFADYLSWPLPLHPWLYPPYFLFALVPFGLLPFAAAGFLFLALGFAGALAACWSVAPRRDRSIHAASLLLAPATAITVCLGQNSFLTAALMVGGFGLIGRRPRLAGAFLGVLTYKPQLWLLVPVALVAGRHWKALASAVLTAAALAVLSGAIFGAQIWLDWLALMTAPSELYEKWLQIGRLNGQSVYTCAVLLGASPALANLAQALSALAAAACVFAIYRSAAADDLRLAVLLAAAMLAAPHLIGYDGVLLAIAATLLFTRALAEGFRAGEAVVIFLAWASPLANPPSIVPLGLATPLLIALFIAMVMHRARAWRAPAPRRSETLSLRA